MSPDTPKGYTEHDVELVAHAIGWDYTTCRHAGETYMECDEHRAHAALAALAGAGRLLPEDTRAVPWAKICRLAAWWWASMPRTSAPRALLSRGWALRRRASSSTRLSIRRCSAAGSSLGWVRGFLSPNPSRDRALSARRMGRTRMQCLEVRRER